MKKADHRTAVVKIIILLFAELGIMGFGGLQQSRASRDR